MKDKCLTFAKFPWASQMIVENRFHGHYHRHGEQFRDIAAQYSRVGRIVCAMIEYLPSRLGFTYWEDIEHSTRDFWL